MQTSKLATQSFTKLFHIHVFVNILIRIFNNCGYILVLLYSYVMLCNCNNHQMTVENRLKMHTINIEVCVY